jgi:Flp pilus assembly protein protease CpaA
MESWFLFVLFFIGLVVATFQDLKRREIDDWLNLFLVISGLAYWFYYAFFSGDTSVIFHVGFLLVVMFLIMNLFYYGRVFAGGDAKLLFAMTPFFVGATFWMSLINIGVFALLLMIAGSIYGIFWSLVLWFLNREQVNAEMGKIWKGNKMLFVMVIVAVLLMIFTVKDMMFFILAGLFFVFPFLYVFAKGLENVSMIREIKGSDLREGDWLVQDVKVGRRVVKANWDGVSLEEIKMLSKKKKVLIKEGIPFVPAFLVAFILYWFLRDIAFGLFAI